MQVNVTIFDFADATEDEENTKNQQRRLPQNDTGN